MISSEISSTTVRPYAIWMISLSTPTPSPITGRSSIKSCPPPRSRGYFSSQRNGMANPNKGQGGPVLPWLCELLSEVYPQLLQYFPPPLCTHSQDPAVGLGFTRAGGIQCPEE